MAEPILQTKGLTAFYGDFQALFGIDLEVGEGEAVAIIGANGAGKSTLMRSISGLLAMAPTRSSGGASPSAICAPIMSPAAASRWCPKAGSSSPRSAWRRTC